MSEILKVKDLCKTYVTNKRQNNVLKNVNLLINEGEMVAIMGPSGSGKSTLLYSVSGMDDVTSGKIEFNKQDINNLPGNELAEVRLKEMGFIFQQMYMLKNLTILDNIILPAYQARLKEKKVVVEDGKNLMKKLGIIDIADNDIDEVSGGQLQRACICRSLINNPKMIFADEPTGSLNRSASFDVMDELIKVNNEGTTIMLVTHDVKIASMCSRIIFLVDGNIKGEYSFNHDEKNLSERDKERTLNNWLNQLGF